ncbi:Nucleoid-associated protein YaaK [hydrothermal vent metagenome]|uniref:Nucleoid-associated protein YaaK n=1 Tax=hydrothermal vent metagenome TaxID=652676 RepID=A0A3B0VA46_9ZZZZ
MFDMMKMMGKVKEAQSKMKEIQDGLAKLITEGESGGGMVKAIVNGKKQLVDLVIDESLYNPEDKDMLKDLIIAATNIAMDKADVLAKEEMRKATEGMLPNIPGLDLSSMM